MENKTEEQEIIWAGLFSCGAGRMASSELQAQAGRQGLGKTATASGGSELNWAQLQPG